MTSPPDRVYHLTPIIGLMSLAAVAVLHACSDSGGGGGTTSTATGGSGGTGGGTIGSGGSAPSGGSTGNGATGGSGGTGGQPGAGGTEAQGGSSSGGSAGEAGSPGTAGEGGMPGALGETCLECGRTGDCAAALEACESASNCQSWLTCVTACDDDACALACDAAAGELAHLLTPIYACLSDTCASECGEIVAEDRSCENSLAPVDVAPATLAETGLFVKNDSGDYEVAPYIKSYEPVYGLWADGAVKQRQIYIPECERIDTNDMDNWDFPVGTRVFKTFSREPSGGGDPITVETRMLHRYGSGEDDWLMVTYQWDASSEASLANPELALLVDAAGVPDANGTDHNIPSHDACLNCHGKLPSTVLGFSAIQLSHDGAGESMRTLSDSGRLTVPNSAGFPVPGDENARAALGMLHANCGHCHNEFFGATTLHMHLLVDQTTVETTSTYETAVAVPADNGAYYGLDRIEPGDAEQSVIWQRMSKLEMPPGNAGNEVPNDAGLEALEAWIGNLPVEQ